MNKVYISLIVCLFSFFVTNKTDISINNKIIIDPGHGDSVPSVT